MLILGYYTSYPQDEYLHNQFYLIVYETFIGNPKTEHNVTSNASLPDIKAISTYNNVFLPTSM